MLRRAVALVLVGIVFFLWGMTSGQHQLFPFNELEPVHKRVTGLLWMFGIVPVPEHLLPKPPPAERAAFAVPTGLVNFDGLILNDSAPIAGHAGALAVHQGGLLIARPADGGVWRYDPAADTLTLLPFRLPPTHAAEVPARMPSGRSVRPSDLRYHDIEIAGGELLVSYNAWDAARHCFVLRLDAAPLPAEPTAQPTLDWRTLFQASPCVPVSDNRNTFAGNQGGGRIVPDGQGGVYLTTGDFEFDGIDGKTPAVSQAEGGLGRVLRIGLADGAVTEISRGHRNPQGLALARDGRLWLAEHGPMGGDELNLIVPGGNYGWPNVTLGRMYAPAESDIRYWPDRPAPPGAIGPVLAWMPSIAPSAMIEVSGLPQWEGDLLVGTLIGQALHRLRLEAGRILYDEPIPLGMRVRDLALLDGRLYLLFDDGRLARLTPRPTETAAALPATRALYDNGCVECHASPSAPRLAGIVGGDIAHQQDIAYSEALAALDGVWDRERLRAFLSDPQLVAPGTTMPAPGLSPEAIETVLDELERLAQ